LDLIIVTLPDTVFIIRFIPDFPYWCKEVRNKRIRWIIS